MFRRALSILLLGIILGINVAPEPVQAAGATLKISPSTGVYEVGGLVDVSFVLDTGGEAVNAVHAAIQFPPEKLQVVNPVASTSFISVWAVPPAYSNTDGRITFEGGLPNPGIKTSAGVISTVTFRVKSAGKATIKYLAASKVLRNDGDGTNILTSTTSADLTLKVPPPAGPITTSPTHGDSNQWYVSRTIVFAWEPVERAVGYSFAFDQTPKREPDDTVDTQATTTTVQADADGIWYFHIRAKADVAGGTTHVAVQIDSTAPAGFTPQLDKDILATEESGSLRFVTTDAASGVDHYEVRQVAKQASGQSNTLFVEAASPYIISQQPAGEYDYIVRAVDRAGNTTEGSATLRVIAGGIPFYARVPLLRDPAVANAALVGLGFLVLLSLVLLILRRVRIRATFRHDLQALERDAQKKAEALQRELEDLRSAQVIMQQAQPPVVPPTNPPPPPS